MESITVCFSITDVANLPFFVSLTYTHTFPCLSLIPFLVSLPLTLSKGTVATML